MSITLANHRDRTVRGLHSNRGYRCTALLVHLTSTSSYSPGSSPSSIKAGFCEASQPWLGQVFTQGGTYPYNDRFPFKETLTLSNI